MRSAGSETLSRGMSTVMTVVKIVGLLAVAGAICFIVGLIASGGGSSINGWTITGVGCILVHAVSLLAAFVADRRRGGKRSASNRYAPVRYGEFATGIDEHSTITADPLTPCRRAASGDQAR